MVDKTETTTIKESEIYEGGSLCQINSKDLIDNEVAIKQLINSHILALSQSKQKDLEIQEFKSTIEYLRTSPFIAIIALIINFCGSIMIGLAVNLFTKISVPGYSWIIISIGIILVLTGSLTNILYPFARKWFNKKSLLNK